MTKGTFLNVLLLEFSTHHQTRCPMPDTPNSSPKNSHSIYSQRFPSSFQTFASRANPSPIPNSGPRTHTSPTRASSPERPRKGPIAEGQPGQGHVTGVALGSATLGHLTPWLGMTPMDGRTMTWISTLPVIPLGGVSFSYKRSLADDWVSIGHLGISGVFLTRGCHCDFEN